MFKNIHHIHFVGIGGSGMSGIAEVLLSLGYRVSGSDLQQSAATKRLQELGAKIFIGHEAAHSRGADVVVTSTAVSKDNPEVLEARQGGIPVIPRVEMLAEIARLKYTIAVAGTHGKTTTSSLIAKVLTECAMDPTVIVGGRLKAVGTGGVLGRGDYLVAEADESDGSFLKLSPTIAVVTNIDDDHLDYYGTSKKLDEAFAQFADHIPFYGVAILCGDDPRIKKMMLGLKRRFETYGFGDDNDWQARDLSFNVANTRFMVYYKGQKLGSLSLALPGRHNVLNALSAVAVGVVIGLTFNQIARALEQFEGVGRRLEFKGEAGGITVFDDYGHHPTEIRSTLSAIRDRRPDAKLHVLFQPHRYSRTQLLYKEFAESFAGVDRLFLMPIYPAGEKPIKGVTSELISGAFKGKNWTAWTPDAGKDVLLRGLKKGDVFLTLGAGDVWKVGERLVLESNSLAAQIVRNLPHLGKRIKTEEPLSRHCTWAIGGPAEIYVEVNDVAEFKAVAKLCQNEKVPVFILGWGSNVLFPDEGLRGCVIRLKGDFEKIEVRGTEIHAGAGVHLPKLARVCAKENLSGVEFMAGIPGTVGGALITNAGTKKGDMSRIVRRVRVLASDGKEKDISKEAIHLRYRRSNLTGYWIVGAVLELEKSQNGAVWKKMKEELDYRQKTQPLGTKNVGSVFTNPENDHAARLIEAVGLKGKQVGKLRFSPKHANFIENLGGGTAKDALELIELAQRLVKKEFNVSLFPEVKIIRPADSGVSPSEEPSEQPV